VTTAVAMIVMTEVTSLAATVNSKGIATSSFQPDRRLDSIE